MIQDGAYTGEMGRYIYINLEMVMFSFCSLWIFYNCETVFLVYPGEKQLF